MTAAPFVLTAASTRLQIQAEIARLRRASRDAVIPSTGRELAEAADLLLDELLLREPEPA